MAAALAAALAVAAAVAAALVAALAAAAAAHLVPRPHLLAIHIQEVVMGQVMGQVMVRGIKITIHILREIVTVHLHHIRIFIHIVPSD